MQHQNLSEITLEEYLENPDALVFTLDRLEKMAYATHEYEISEAIKRVNERKAKYDDFITQKNLLETGYAKGIHAAFKSVLMELEALKNEKGSGIKSENEES